MIPFRKPTIRLTSIQKVILLLCVLVVITFILRYFTKESDQSSIPATSITNTTSLPSQSVEIEIVGTTPDTPQKLSLVPVIKKTLTFEELSRLLQITTPIGTNAYIDQTKTRTIAYSPETHAIFYTNSPKSGEFSIEDVSIINTEKAIKDAEGFLQTIFGNVPLIADRSSIIYLDVTKDEHDTDSPLAPEEASLAIIPFFYAVDGYTVYIDNHSRVPVEVYVDSAGNVIKAEMSLTQFTPGQTQTIDSLSFDEALKEKKNISVLSISNPTLTTLPYESLRKLTVQSIQLEYRLISAQSLLIPMYRCIGTAVYTDSNVESEIDFVIPAVKVRAQEN